MRQALFATLLAPLVLAATPVLAADLPRGSPPPQDYYSPRPVANWEGFYAGINGGIGFGSFTDGADTLFASPTGGLIGVTAGYNHMVAPNLLIGIESDFDFAGLSASQNPYFGLATQGSINDMFTIRGRVEFSPTAMAFGPSSLLLENGVIKVWGTRGVGNVNWSYGNCVIDYGTAAGADFSWVQ